MWLPRPGTSWRMFKETHSSTISRIGLTRKFYKLIFSHHSFFLLFVLLVQYSHIPLESTTIGAGTDFKLSSLFCLRLSVLKSSNFDSDPTHGIVAYQSKSSATSSGLTYIDGKGNAIIKVDDTTQLAQGVNRKSVRLMSKNTYSTGLSIIDVNQIPYGTCSGTWPAWWMYGPDWPNSGEIDIIEQVENASNNKMSLHTSQGCTLTSSSSSNPYTGNLAASNCYAYSSTYGCSIDDSNNKGPSYGSAFKANGGGVWATRFVKDGISIWWWPRGSVPSDITAGKPMPLTWGTPSFNVASSSCNVANYFKNMQFVINIALGEY